MKFNDLKVTKNRKGNRVGRGIAAGQGKTAGRGTKGQGARKSSNLRPGFEGGQNPISKSMPKLPGFTSHRPKAHNIYTGQLDAFAGKTVDNHSLVEAGLTPSAYIKTKLIVKGDVTKKVTVKLQGASQAAIDAVQKAGGTFTKTAQVKRPPKNPKEEKAKK
jgi:large subunit ribosomal protein L15